LGLVTDGIACIPGVLVCGLSALAVMGRAAANECVVLTHDLDFGAILAASQRRKPSVVQIKARDAVCPSLSRKKAAARRLRLTRNWLPHHSICPVALN